MGLWYEAKEEFDRYKPLKGAKKSFCIWRETVQDVVAFNKGGDKHGAGVLNKTDQALIKLRLSQWAADEAGDGDREVESDDDRGHDVNLNN
jgi:hypothetical protein